MNPFRILRPTLFPLVLLAALLIVPAVIVTPASAQTPAPNRAGLVISFSANDVRTYCVSFEPPEISGDELLLRSGVGAVISAEGAVCRIGTLGCPADDCFCQCPFPSCKYWAYYEQQNGAWNCSQSGPMFSVVRNGDVNGWSWGQGDFSQGVEPPLLTFEQVCPDATPTPAPTATPAPSPAPAPTPALPPAEVPEPGTLVLAASGLAALAGFAGRAMRRR